MRLRLWAACAAVALSSSSTAFADPVADFYAGRTIIVVVGSEAGGGYDTQAHLMARHLGDFIPGHPSIVVQNMPGAGSINAANYLYNVAPKDGTTIGLIQRTLMSANLTNQKGVRFDVQKFNWIGNLATEVPLFVSWHTSPIKTVEDLFKHEMVMGGGGPTSDSEVQARMLNALIGTKIKIVSGYTGEAQIQLAMERGEVEAMGAWGWSNLKSRAPEYLTDRKVNILIQGALQRAADLPDVPTPFDFVNNDDDRKVLELFYAQQMVARPIVAPPDLPADRLAALRKAFADMAESGAFRDDSKKMKLDASATPYESIEKVISIIGATPPAIAARFAAINNPPN
jgi:tripartite-type tricarboxylate transporter receptor subunit TctC